MNKSILLFITGALGVVILLEILFRVLPVSTSTRSGYYINPHILTYPAHHCFTIATGWDLKNSRSNCSNNYGFIAERDFGFNPEAIALIGDSYVEANMLPARERLDKQLETKLGGRPVYAMGGPGSNILDYTERAKFAYDKFGIRTFVFIIERGDLWQSLCGSRNIHARCLDAKTLLPRTETIAPPDTFKQLMRESALAQYVYSQLRFNVSKVMASLRPKNAPVLAEDEKYISSSANKKIVDQFFEQIISLENAHFLFLIDADRRNLFTQQQSSEDKAFSYFKHSAAQFHADVLDPTLEFQKFERVTGRKLEVGPYDHHWNGSAIRIISEIIYKRLCPDGTTHCE